MSSEICTICKTDFTPWSYIERLDVYIYNGCVKHLMTLLNKERMMRNLYEDIVKNKLKEKEEVLRLVKKEIEEFRTKDDGIKILTILISNFEQLNIECHLLEEIIAEVNREHTISTSIRKESDNDKGK